MLSSIEIAQRARLRPITEIASDLNIPDQALELYGHYKAKVNPKELDLGGRPKGKLIYTTAITATPAGEGKTTTAIGLTQALGVVGMKSMVCLREPSLGPTFGIKGGAAGGGYAQVLPMEDINLHFTGDMHAVGAAHNLLAAALENKIFRGNRLGINPKRVLWKRVVDMNDRQLREIVVGLGGEKDGFPLTSGFDITSASEIMAILCLARDLMDLKERLGEMLVAYTYDGEPVYARDIKVTGAMAVLLKDAVKPNLVQTIEGQPAFIHGGPFANIAHGNNSAIATKTALQLADYVVTEGGFGSDLGAEKFFDIVHGYTGLVPDLAVLVVTVRALKMHGGKSLDELDSEDLTALRAGAANMRRHVHNLQQFGLPVVIAINCFPQDTERELQEVRSIASDLGVPAAVSTVVTDGGAGGVELAETVLQVLEEQKANFRPLYDWNLPIKKKIEILAEAVYGAAGVEYAGTAEQDIAALEQMGKGNLPLCMAKTQHSLSDNPALKGAPTGWHLTVREVRASLGAGFLIPITGGILTMPGLPEVPAAEQVDIDASGKITGLF